VSPSLLTRANPPATANANGAGIARFPGRSAEKYKHKQGFRLTRFYPGE
jgi:hypothetical protein